MASVTTQYQPDYAVPPGWVLDERLKAQGISQAEFARRCGRSAKLISEIIAGKAPVEPETALQFEKVLDVDARIWLRIDSDYQLQRAREAEALAAAEASAWAARFPIKELVKRKVFAASPAPADDVPKLLAFFGVGSVDAWQRRYEATAGAYLHSPSFDSDEFALFTWRRLAEVEADQQSRPPYSAPAFRRALSRVRRLLSLPVDRALPETLARFNEAGVALAFVEPLPKVRVRGAAWWLTPSRPLIALSGRHKTDDHLWFSLFHEAAHILLHSKKTVFIDGTRRTDDELDAEANAWAARTLIPDPDWRRFADTGVFTQAAICAFAEHVGIPPGIVVGRLQHEGRVPWGSALNGLKVKLEWR